MVKDNDQNIPETDGKQENCIVPWNSFVHKIYPPSLSPQQGKQTQTNNRYPQMIHLKTEFPA